MLALYLHRDGTHAHEIDRPPFPPLDCCVSSEIQKQRTTASRTWTIKANSPMSTAMPIRPMLESPRR